MNEKPIRIVERSIHSSKHVFIEASKMGPIHKKILNDWYEFVCKRCSIEVNLIVYLKTSPEISLQRIIQRGRLEEKSIDFQYLEVLNRLHDEWLLNNSSTRVVVVDGNLDEKSIVEEYKRVLDEIHKNM